MTPLRRSLFLLACAAAGVGLAGPAAAEADVADAAPGEVLVMLRQAPPHFRPDSGYGGGYDGLAGGEGRRRVARQLAREYALEVESDWPMASLGVDCFLMRAAADQAQALLLQRLRDDPRIESAQTVNLFRTLGHDDPLFPLQPAASVWHLAELHQVATGRNVRVAEVDSGVDTSQPDLRGQIAATANFVDGSAYVGELHGTAVAGIIAAKADNGIGIAGVAPDARLVALRACWQQREGESGALCSSFTLAKALQFALDADARVINMSLGGPPDRLLERLLDAAAAKGITVVAAIDPRRPGGGFPASHRGVIGVADERMAGLAGGAWVAPGADVPTTLPGARWDFVSGSSFAAAHASGLVALLKERAPDIDPAQVLDGGGADGVRRTASGGGVMIDACATFRRATGICACDCLPRREAGLLRR